MDFKLLDSLLESVMVTDTMGRIVFVNEAFSRITGYPAEYAIGNTPRILCSGFHDRRFYRELWSTLKSGHSFRSVFVNRDSRGRTFEEETSITACRAGNGKEYFVSIARPLPEARSQVRQPSRRDTLTGLLQRNAFLEQVQSTFGEPGRYLLACIDLDNFDRINRERGHLAGDELLCAVAHRLQLTFPGSPVARLYSDEFAILLQMPGTTGARHLLGQLQCAFNAVFNVGGDPLHLRASIGSASVPRDGRNADIVLSRAKLAVRDSKSSGGNLAQPYQPSMGETPAGTLGFESELHNALANNEFRIHLQPQVDLGNRKLLGVEALLRWEHPCSGLTEAARFIDALENSAFSLKAGAWVIEAAAREFLSIPEALRPPRLCINLSPRHFRRPELVTDLRRAIEITGIDPGCIELEITEHAVMQCGKLATRALDALRELGTRIAIDDFATGYSSLSYLMHFPVDTLKIPRNFVMHVEDKQVCRDIIVAICRLAEAISAQVVAEGVSSEEEAQLLLSLGCDIGQGWYFGKAMPASQLAAEVASSTN